MSAGKIAYVVLTLGAGRLFWWGAALSTIHMVSDSWLPLINIAGMSSLIGGGYLERKFRRHWLLLFPGVMLIILGVVWH
jgi:hypothetical protein